MTRYLYMLSILLLCCAEAAIAQNKSYDLSYFLGQFLDMKSLPQYVSDSYSASFSTYDRRGGNDDGFGGTYSFIRRNADSSLVIAELHGPGVITRIWTPTPTNDSLEFYIDDSTRPAFSIRYRDLYTGKVYPFVSPLCANQLGGFYCYLPIPFSKYFKIVAKTKKLRFHQINYRLFPGATGVKSFSINLKEEEKDLLEQINKSWAHPGKRSFADPGTKKMQSSITLKPGDTRTVFMSATGGRIEGFMLHSNSALDSIARQIDLRITWDDERSPAVLVPLADFFGYAFGTASMQSLLAGSDGKTFYCFFPMPFDKKAHIEMIYRNGALASRWGNISFVSTIFLNNKPRNPATEGKFYAAWSRENPVAIGNPYTMLDVTGKGHLVGVALQAQGLVPGITGFFEGDDSTVVDGELRFHGTGSEDFFNGGWYALLDCWDDAMSLPLSGSLDYSIPLSRTGGYRLFITDKINFAKSIHHSIEHGGENNQWPSDYSSVSYYYCDQPPRKQLTPANALTTIYSPDTLELYPQLMFTALEGDAAAYSRWDGTPAKTMFYTISNETVLKMFLYKIPPAAYDVYLDYRKGPKQAAFSLWQRQSQLSEWTNAFNASEQRMSMQKLATIEVTDNNRSLSFRFKTEADKNRFTLTRIVLIRKQ